MPEGFWGRQQGRAGTSVLVQHKAVALPLILAKAALLMPERGAGKPFGMLYLPSEHRPLPLRCGGLDYKSAVL